MFTTNCRAVMLAALAMASACLLAACDGDAPEPNQAAPVAAKVPAPKVAMLSNQMVAAVSAGKTAGAIGVHFALGSPPAVGKALPVRIAIVPHRNFESVRAHFESHDGLTVTAGGDFGPKTDVDSETALEHQLLVMPSKEGLYMVTASLDTDSDEGYVTRIFSIPVIVGPAQGAAPASAHAVPAPDATVGTPAN